MEDVCLKAATLPLDCTPVDKFFVSCLLVMCNRTMHKVEDIKKKAPQLKSGVVACLDQISQQLLLSIGLLDQTMKG